MSHHIYLQLFKINVQNLQLVLTRFAGSASTSITGDCFLQLQVSAGYRFLPVLVKTTEILNRRRFQSVMKR